jgi:putative FmdB family regulatory protein
MPVYDFRCTQGHTFERYARYDEPVPCPDCGKTTEHIWLPGTRHVIGDECDETIANGLCNADGTPRRFTSKSEIQKEAKRRGLTQYVQHQPGRGSDKSKWTQRWY